MYEEDGGGSRKSQKQGRVFKDLQVVKVEHSEQIKNAEMETIVVEVGLWKVDGEELELEKNIYPSWLTLYD